MIGSTCIAATGVRIGRGETGIVKESLTTGTATAASRCSTTAAFTGAGSYAGSTGRSSWRSSKSDFGRSHRQRRSEARCRRGGRAERCPLRRRAVRLPRFRRLRRRSRSPTASWKLRMLHPRRHPPGGDDGDRRDDRVGGDRLRHPRPQPWCHQRLQLRSRPRRRRRPPVRKRPPGFRLHRRRQRRPARPVPVPPAALHARPCARLRA